MKYSEYEYNVLEKLNELLIIESTNIMDFTIIFNLSDNFHCEFDRNILREAYEQGCPEYNTVLRIREHIMDKYVEEYAKRKRLERKEILKSD